MANLRIFAALDQDRLGFVTEVRADLPDGMFRVSSRYAAMKHGTELTLWKGHAAKRGAFDPVLRLHDDHLAGITFPLMLGNMFVGVVVESRHAGYEVGDPVLGYGPIANEHVLDGSGVWKLIAPVARWQDYVCLDPATFALAAVRDGNVRIGDTVAIFGMGAIGLMAVQCALLAGASLVIAVDRFDARLECATGLGAHRVFQADDGDIGLKIKRVTGGRGVDVCIDYSGAAAALQAALRATALGGTVVAGAFSNPYPAGLDFGGEAHMNRLNLIFSRACTDPNRDHPRWTETRLQETVLSLLDEKKLAGDQIVWPVIDFEELPSRCESFLSDGEKAIKLGVRFA